MTKITEEQYNAATKSIAAYVIQEAEEGIKTGQIVAPTVESAIDMILVEMVGEDIGQNIKKLFND